MKPMDLTKFRNKLTASIPGISIGSRNPTDWLSFGHYAFNWLMGGDFYKAFPLGKVMVLAGEPGSGKSYLLAQAMIDAQRQGMYVIDFDSENAHDAEWLERLGFDTKDPKYLKVDVYLVDQVAGSIDSFLKDYEETYKDVEISERPKVLIAVDSFSMLNTPSDIAQFERGDMKGDMGRQAKQLKALVKACVVRFGMQNIGMIGTAHTSASQDMFNPDANISGGMGIIYVASMVAAFRKWKLKLNEQGEKTVTQGIRTNAVQRKSRYNVSALWKDVDVHIDTTSGIRPYSGLQELLEMLGLLVKDGSMVTYTDLKGQVHSHRVSGKGKSPIPKEFFHIVMDEWPVRKESINLKVDEELRAKLAAQEKEAEADEI